MNKLSIKKYNIGFDSIIYGIYASIIPLNMIMNFTGATINKLVGIVASGLMILHVVFRGKYKHYKNPNYGLIIYVFISVISVAWSINQSLSLFAMRTLFSLILIYVAGKMREFNYRELFVICVEMIIVAAIIPFFFNIDTTVSYSRSTLVNDNGSADQNGLAFNLVFVAILALDLFFSLGNKMLKVLMAIATILILIGIVLTGSRGALVGLFSSLLFYLIKKFPSLKKKKSFWGTVLLIVLAFIIGIYYLENIISDALLRRFSLESLIHDRGSGRLDIWLRGLDLIVSNPLRCLFGFGYGTQKYVFYESFGYYAAAHNVFLQVWFETGIIGLFFFVWGLFKFWMMAIKQKNYVSNALWIAMFFALFTLNFGTNKGTWNIFLLIYLFSLNSNFSNNITITKNNKNSLMF